MRRLGMVQVIAETLPRMLLQVKQKCVCFEFYNIHFLVGFGAAIMGGAFVMRHRGMTAGTLFSAGMSVTLCSWGLTVSGHGKCWG
jgi:hypothetical protein